MLLGLSLVAIFAPTVFSRLLLVLIGAAATGWINARAGRLVAIRIGGRRMEGWSLRCLTWLTQQACGWATSLLRGTATGLWVLAALILFADLMLNLGLSLHTNWVTATEGSLRTVNAWLKAGLAWIEQPYIVGTLLIALGVLLIFDKRGWLNAVLAGFRHRQQVKRTATILATLLAFSLLSDAPSAVLTPEHDQVLLRYHVALATERDATFRQIALESIELAEPTLQPVEWQKLFDVANAEMNYNTCANLDDLSRDATLRNRCLAGSWVAAGPFRVPRNEIISGEQTQSRTGPTPSGSFVEWLEHPPIEFTFVDETAAVSKPPSDTTTLDEQEAQAALEDQRAQNAVANLNNLMSDVISLIIDGSAAQVWPQSHEELEAQLRAVTIYVAKKLPDVWSSWLKDGRRPDSNIDAIRQMFGADALARANGARDFVSPAQSGPLTSSPSELVRADRFPGTDPGGRDVIDPVVRDQIYEATHPASERP
jgi:hypothetical protein